YMSASSGGTLSVVLDTNSPPYVIVSPGQTVELARIKYSATNEDIDLKQVALQLSSVASNTPENLVGRQVTIHTTDGVQIATAVFPTGDNATSSAIASGAFRIPRDSSKVLVVKGTIAGITASGPMTRSGDLLVVNYDGDNEGGNTSTDGNYGVGASSGNNVNPVTSDTTSSGVRIMKTYPEFSRIPLTTSETLLLAGADRTLYKFSVKATNGDVAIYKFTLSVGSSTVSATTTTYGLYAYTDTAFASADTTFSSTGLMNASNRIGGTGSNQSCLMGSSACLVEIYPDKSSATTTYIIPSGATRYFWLRATVSSVETGTGSESISVNLQGDASYPVNSANLMETPANTDGDAQDDFIWSPISTTTQNTINDLDFTNGYQVRGLPDTNMTAEILTSTN
ncbi:MAG: hypothetical protein HYU35_03200, partial [Parcubacteria group bacterium]|nr:hypothetical protein [Parcubacteria group bacterium]